MYVLMYDEIDKIIHELNRRLQVINRLWPGMNLQPTIAEHMVAGMEKHGFKCLKLQIRGKVVSFFGTVNDHIYLRIRKPNGIWSYRYMSSTGYNCYTRVEPVFKEK